MSLAEWIAAERQRIVLRWTERVQRMAHEARHLDRPTLVDHIPGVLDEIIAALERHGVQASNPQAVEHGKQRLRAGFDLATVVHEYGVLRDCILDVVAERGATLSVEEARSLGNSINVGIAEAVVEYSQSRTHIIETFISVLGHDLLDPLNAVATGAQLILRHQGELPPVVMRVCGRIAANADRIGNLLHELMDFSRAGLGGGLRLRRRWVDLREVATRAADELEIAHPEREIVVESAGPCFGSLDPDRLRQVFAYLGAHALRHGSPIRFQLHATHDELIVECRHQGASPLAGKLFDPFVSDDAPGLGLYLVREIVRAHDGTVEVEDSEEAETTLRVRLPRGAS